MLRKISDKKSPTVGVSVVIQREHPISWCWFNTRLLSFQSNCLPMHLCHPHRPGCNAWLLASAWPTPSYCSHLGSDSTDRRDISSYLSLWKVYLFVWHAEWQRKQRERERERSSFNWLISQWLGLSPNTWVMFHCSSGCISSELDQKHSSPKLTQHPYEMPAQQVLA